MKNLQDYSLHSHSSVCAFHRGRKASCRHPPEAIPNFTTAAGDHALQALTLALGTQQLVLFPCLASPLAISTPLLALQPLILTPRIQIRPLALQRFCFNTTGYKKHGQWSVCPS